LQYPPVCGSAKLLQQRFAESGFSKSSFTAGANTMNRSFMFVVAFLSAGVCLISPVDAKSKKSASTQPAEQKSPEEIAAQETTDADNRANSIVQSLDIEDSTKSAHVHDTIAAQYKAIHEWHAANDAQRKALSTTQPAGDDADKLKEIQASYQELHDHFITALSADLTPEQIDKVKEKMTGGQMTATLKNYPVIVPNLTDEDLSTIKTILEQARDDAMDANTKNERIAIFKKYKGKINNYLDAHGHNVKQAYKDFGAAQKAKQSAPATQPEANSAGN
jgi:hypothetical protein